MEQKKNVRRYGRIKQQKKDGKFSLWYIGIIILILVAVIGIFFLLKRR